MGPAALAPASSYEWHLPPGLPVPLVPADNPMSAAKVALGRRLFYDTRLSGTGTYACASCHQQAHAFTDGRAHALGATGGVHAHGAMSLTNVAYNASFGWADSTRRTLEAQMAVPMFNEHPIELGLAGREAEVVARFSSREEDAREFRLVFGDDPDPVTLPNIVKAIAAFERTLLSGDSPFDRYLYRDERSAISPAAVRGMTLFFSARLHCSECHTGFNLSGPTAAANAPEPALLFHNTALYDVDGRGSYPAGDRGLVEVTGKRDDMGRFRAPTLRNVALTAPYMHDGSLPTLQAVIDHYASGGHKSRYVSDRVRGFSLSGTDRDDLVAFLQALTDESFLTNPAFGAPPRADVD